MITRAALLSLGFCALLEPSLAREFKSADGSKTFEADFLRFNNITKKVTLKLNGKNVLMPVTAFSDEDQQFFISEQKKVDMKESVTVKIDRDSKTDREKNDKGQVSATKHTTFNFVVKNESYSTLEGMKLKYWVLVQHKKGKEEEMEVINKEMPLGSIEPGAESIVSGPTISIKEQKGGKGGGKGKEKQEDDIYGAKYELVSPDGEVLKSESSSNRVENYLNR